MFNKRRCPKGINLSRSEVSNLKKMLPQYKRLLDEDEQIIKKYYNQVAICIFDHWLERDEINLIFTKDKEEINSRRMKLESFITKLYSLTDVYFWRYKRHYRPHVYKPRSLHDVLKYCNFDDLTEDRGESYNLVLPDFSAVYSESFDWTNRLLYQDRTKISPILELADEVGLYKLEYL